MGEDSSDEDETPTPARPLPGAPFGQVEFFAGRSEEGAWSFDLLALARAATLTSLVDWLVGWSVGRSVGWLVGWLVGWCINSVMSWSVLSDLWLFQLLRLL